MTSAPGSPSRRAQDLHWLPRILVAFMAVHFASAAWPVAPVEGDELGVLHGLAALAQQRADYRDVAYLFPLQPGSYALLHAIQKTTGADALNAFAACSLAGAAAFVCVASFILHALTGMRPAWVAVVLLTAQELSAAAAYANSSALAAPVVALGLLLSLHTKTAVRLFAPGICFAVGGWLRLDALLLTPALLPLLLRGGNSFGYALRQALSAALESLALLTVLFFLSGTSLGSAFGVYAARDGGVSWQRLLSLGWLSLSGALVLAAAAGLIVLVRRREYRLLLVIVAAAAPSLLVYGRSLTTTKYLYYAVPFLALPAIVWLQSLAQSPSRLSRRTLLAWIAFACTGIFIGVRTASPGLRRFEPPAFAWVRGEIRLGSKHFRLGPGSGEIVPTDDGFRVRGGLWHAPAIWRREKHALLAEQERLTAEALLSHTADKVVVTSTYFAYQLLKLQLLEAGFSAQRSYPFEPNRSSFLGTWQRSANEPALQVYYVNHTSADSREFAAAARAAAGKTVLFLNDRGANAAQRLMAGQPGWQRLSPHAHGLLSLHRRPPLASPAPP